MIAKLPIRIPSRLRAFLWWLGYSALWATVLLFITTGRLVWLCVFAGGVLGFLTDCAVDIFASRSHQARMRRQFLDQEESYRSHRSDATNSGGAPQ